MTSKFNFGHRLDNFNDTVNHIKKDIGRKNSPISRDCVDENGFLSTSAIKGFVNTIYWMVGCYSEKSQVKHLLRQSFDALKRSMIGKEETVLYRTEFRQLVELESQINHLNDDHLKKGIEDISQCARCDKEQLKIAKDLDAELKGIGDDENVLKVFLEKNRDKVGMAYEEARAVIRHRLKTI